jgi:hypothetical protein
MAPRRSPPPGETGWSLGPTPASSIKSRVLDLSRNKIVPREIAQMMLLITEMRNAAEYEHKVLSASESRAVKHAWEAINEWAESQGIRLAD